MKKLDGILLEIMENASTGQDIDTPMNSCLVSTLKDYMAENPEDLAYELCDLLMEIHYGDYLK